MSVAELIDNGNVVDAFNPVTRDQSDVIEVTGLAVQNSLDNYQTFSASNLKDSELRSQQEMIEGITGSGLFDIIGNDARENEINRFERVDELIKSDPVRFAGVPLSDQVIENARQRARLSAQEFQEATQNTDPFSATFGGFTGGLAGTAVDPVNLALLPVGAGAGSNFLKAVAIEAGVNAGAEALTQPAIASWQREIGNEYGFGDAVANVGFAALLGGGFAAVARGAQPAASAAFEYISKSDGVPGAVKNSIKQLADYAHIKERNPYENATSKLEEHADNISATSRAFEQRKSMNDVDIDGTGYKPELFSRPSGEGSLLAKRSPSTIPALFSSSSLSSVPSRDGLNITSVNSRSGADTQSLDSVSQRTDSKSSPETVFDTATISPLRNPGAVSIGRIDPTSNYIVYQPSKDVNKIIDLAKKSKPDLETFLRENVKGLKGADFYGVRVKESDSLQDKLQGKGRDIDGIGDVLGGRVVVDNYTAMRAVVDILNSKARIIELENKITKDGRGQYRAIHAIVTSKNGVSAEIQIQPRPVREVQDKAHDIYKKWRDVDPSTLTPKQRKQMLKDQRKAAKMFDGAWKKWEKSNKKETVVDDDSFIRPLVEEPRPRTTPADVDSDVSVTAMASAEKLKSSPGPEVLPDAEVRSIRDAEGAEIRRLSEQDPDFEIRLDDDELQALFPGKQRVTVKDIVETMEADRNLLDAVNVCATG